MRRQTTPTLQALLAAALFGASTPLARLMLGEIEPVPLSAFFYLGSGIVLTALLLAQRLRRTSSDREAPLRRSDLPWLSGAILAGGVIAPVVLMYSLRVTPPATASLLLNFETVATTLIAALVFREALSRPAWLAVLLVSLASILLSFNGSAAWGVSLGAAGVLVATALWGLDNNLTRNISAKNPLSIVAVKGLAAGCILLMLAVLIGSRFPTLELALGAMLLGCVCYGLSIVLFVRALRGIGAARTGALFGAAPLAGVLLSLLIFRQAPPLAFWIALPLTLTGAALLLREQHGHDHSHERLAHEHAHRHDDEHHNHLHDSLSVDSHSHSHEHQEMVHSHEHLPDIHHRHDH